MIALPVDITSPAPSPIALSAGVLLATALLVVVGVCRPRVPGARSPRRGTFALLLVSIAVAVALTASAMHPRPATLTIETRPHVAVSPMSQSASRPRGRARRSHPVLPATR